jgi:excisionase family DNA binding protein
MVKKSSPRPAVILERTTAARFLKIGVSTLDAKIRAGEIPSFKLGGRRLFTQQSLNHWIASKLEEDLVDPIGQSSSNPLQDDANVGSIARRVGQQGRVR